MHIKKEIAMDPEGGETVRVDADVHACVCMGMFVFVAWKMAPTEFSASRVCSNMVLRKKDTNTCPCVSTYRHDSFHGVARSTKKIFTSSQIWEVNQHGWHFRLIKKYTSISHTLTCSRWRWPRLFSAGSLCPCCTPLPVLPLFLPYPLLLLLLLGFSPARGQSDWRTSRCPAWACCGDSSKSKRPTKRNNNKHKVQSVVVLVEPSPLTTYGSGIKWKQIKHLSHPKTMIGVFHFPKSDMFLLVKCPNLSKMFSRMFKLYPILIIKAPDWTDKTQQNNRKSKSVENPKRNSTTLRYNYCGTILEFFLILMAVLAFIDGWLVFIIHLLMFTQADTKLRETGKYRESDQEEGKVSQPKGGTFK